MFVDIKGDITTVSHLGWTVDLIFNNGKFTHFDLPRYKGVVRPSERTVSYDEQKFSFINLNSGPNVDIGAMNKDESFGDYASIKLTEDGYKIRHSSIGREGFKNL